MFGFIKSNILDSDIIKDIKTESIPTVFDLTNNSQHIFNQGDTPYCVPYSINSYVNLELAMGNGGVGFDDNRIDYQKIYNIRELKHLEGMQIKEALLYFKNNGIDTPKGNMKISNYGVLKSVENLKRALVSNNICIGALPVYNSNNDKFWEKNGKLSGGHAIALVGYNEKGFIIKNSWGRSWGNKGFGLLPYNEFGSFYEVWTIIK